MYIGPFSLSSRNISVSSTSSYVSLRSRTAHRHWRWTAYWLRSRYICSTEHIHQILWLEDRACMFGPDRERGKKVGAGSSQNLPSKSLARGRLPMNQTTDLGRPDGSRSSAGGNTAGGGIDCGASRRTGGGGEKSRLRSSDCLLFLRGGEKPLCRFTGGW